MCPSYLVPADIIINTVIAMLVCEGILLFMVCGALSLLQRPQSPAQDEVSSA